MRGPHRFRRGLPSSSPSGSRTCPERGRRSPGHGRQPLGRRIFRIFREFRLRPPLRRCASFLRRGLWSSFGRCLSSRFVPAVLGGGLLAFLTARSFRVPPFASLILGVVAAAGAGFAVGRLGAAGGAGGVGRVGGGWNGAFAQRVGEAGRDAGRRPGARFGERRRRFGERREFADVRGSAGIPRARLDEGLAVLHAEVARNSAVLGPDRMIGWMHVLDDLTALGSVWDEPTTDEQVRVDAISLVDVYAPRLVRAQVESVRGRLGSARGGVGSVRGRSDSVQAQIDSTLQDGAAQVQDGAVGFDPQFDSESGTAADESHSDGTPSGGELGSPFRSTEKIGSSLSSGEGLGSLPPSASELGNGGEFSSGEHGSEYGDGSASENEFASGGDGLSRQFDVLRQAAQALRAQGAKGRQRLAWAEGAALEARFAHLTEPPEMDDLRQVRREVGGMSAGERMRDGRGRGSAEQE